MSPASRRSASFAALFLTIPISPHLAASSAPQSVLVPGLEHAHTLTEVQEGRVLLQELRCTACHAAPDQEPLPGPDLKEVTRRVRLEYLRAFLADPSSEHPGSAMPDLIDDEQVVEDLLHFLASQSNQELAPQAAEAGDPKAGQRLFHSVGCVACHAPRSAAVDGSLPEPSPAAVSLDHVPGKFEASRLSRFLFQPLDARPAGRMPDLGLTRKESRDLAAYLIPEDPATSAPLAVDLERAQRGAGHFRTLGCAHCHELPSSEPVERVEAKALSELNPAKGCLDPEDEASPRFALSVNQTRAMRAALAAAQPASRSETIDERLTSLNCIACHQRGELGGVTDELDAYFQTDEPELGDEARIPPPLHEVGAKLRASWLREVLYDGASVRPYMKTRMPRFGSLAVADLSELLLEEDSVEAYPLLLPESGDQRKEYREAGRELLGNRGLACIACHTFNSKRGPGFQGVDLLASYERLEPHWFARFLIDPQAYRPGIVMPESWSGGRAAHQGILEGDTRRQLEAIWYFLSLGTSARDPEGISRIPTRLAVTDRTRVYRGRSNVAGFRGIAVGFPGGLSYAWDAETGALAAIWNGDWVSVQWSGQGAGDFRPGSSAVQLGHALALYRLKNSEEPWPLLPFMDEENPVNPDPQYPRNLGYRFAGYALDPEGTPTFEYANGSIQVREHLAPAENGSVLRRSLTLASESPQTTWLRVAAGDLQPTEAGIYTTDRLRIVLPDLPYLLRSFDAPASTPEESTQKGELLLRIDLPSGQTELAIDYVLLP